MSTTQRVEGYQILVDGKTEPIGFPGVELSEPAYSKKRAKAILDVLSSIPNFKLTLILQIIRSARYVRLTSGYIIDNGPEVPQVLNN